jgi:hypothetical protein
MNRQMDDSAEVAVNGNHPKTNSLSLSSKLEQTKVVHFRLQEYLFFEIILIYASVAETGQVINYLHV